MRQLRTAVLHFVLVFSAGFLLGTVRVLFVVPAIGARAAELIEMPLMLAIVVVAARFITRRTALERRAQWLQVGAIACMLVLLADVSVGLGLRGMYVWQALFDRDPLSGAAYYLSLGVLAFAPWLLAGRLTRAQGWFHSIRQPGPSPRWRYASDLARSINRCADSAPSSSTDPRCIRHRRPACPTTQASGR
jgi:hypothetical protein